MAEIHGPGGPLPHIPDDLTIVQFMLDYEHESRPSPAFLPDRCCLIEDATGKKVTLNEIRMRVDRLAGALHARYGIKDDDVVCVCSSNHIDYPVVIWAIHRLGGIVTPANPAYTVGELEHQLTLTNASMMIVHSSSYTVAATAALAAGISDDRIAFMDALPNELASKKHVTVQELLQYPVQTFVERCLAPGEASAKLAFLSLSSGTTGKAKAVCIPHRAMIGAIIQMAHMANSQTVPWDDRQLRHGDIWMALLPFYHIAGLMVVLHFGFFYGATLVVVPKYNFVEMLTSIERHRIQFLFVVPPMVVLLCKHPAVKEYALHSLRMLLSGAAPLSPELAQQLSTMLPWVNIGQGYGMTETVASISFPRSGQKISTPGSSGQLLPGNIARIIRPDGSLAGYNEAGQLVIKAPYMASGYLKNEKATRETFVDGWLYTGDEVMINKNAEVFILDRVKELLKVRGYQVAPAELESHLLMHPEVFDVCVVGMPDEYSGELPFAFVVATANALQRMRRDEREASELRRILIKHVADSKVPYKWLAGVEFIESIPKNPSGKLLRRVLRERVRALQKQGKLVTTTKARL
ncbi:amp dependent CoA ligase [Laetiporus sulphureus 93-53]|uniref:Amp dependent CoA ligase n=1 Tax=Laetiporus sulphureus 93-53 TaxID=1314785 RepID=A0A165F1P7_9APHY|nr:amp dependent CoA ligase [Laetiporus sulphureus 93-53]KZT08186.1 amp dependent CoA ligase [Laetiporus sulphureus 93-53]